MHIINEEGDLEELGVLGDQGPDPLQQRVEKAGPHLVEGSIDDDLKDTAQVHDDFHGMVGFQARFCR